MVTQLIRTLIIYAVISVVLRSMGKRQVGELEPSELVASLLLSEVASLPIADQNIPMLNALIPILTVLCLEIILTFLKNKCNPLKALLEGKPSILIRNGKPNQKELARMRLSIEELIGECRLQGYTDLTDIAYAILEQNGQLSILPTRAKEPLCADDLGLSSKESGLAHPVILDGQIKEHHLRMIGRDRAWLEKECTQRGCRPADVFLMTVDDAGKILFYRREKA